MSEREVVIETVDRLFVATDQKDWPTVEQLFAPKVHFDMTSLAGGEPAVLEPKQIVDGWREGLKDVAALQHQSGNHRVTLTGDLAEVCCYATATHFHPEREKKLTQFYGDYHFKLARMGRHWRIDYFRFAKKFVVDL